MQKIANLGSFRILLPFFRTYRVVGFLNSAIFNSIHKSGWFWHDFGGPSEFRGVGGGWTPQPPSPRYATAFKKPLLYFCCPHCTVFHIRKWFWFLNEYFWYKLQMLLLFQSQISMYSAASANNVSVSLADIPSAFPGELQIYVYVKFHIVSPSGHAV